MSLARQDVHVLIKSHSEITQIICCYLYSAGSLRRIKAMPVSQLHVLYLLQALLITDTDSV